MEVQIAIERYLLRCGFTADLKSGSEGGRVFRGVLDRAGIDPIMVLIWIYDWSLSKYPVIYLKEGERYYNTVSAHINWDRSLCYIAPGEVVLNAFAPESAIELCLETASRLISRFDACDPTLLTDYRDEFNAYWSNDRSRIYAVDGLVKSHYHLHIDNVKERGVWLVSPNRKEHNHLYEYFSNGNECFTAFSGAFVITSEENWPKDIKLPLPENLKEFLEWVRINSPKSLLSLVRLLSLSIFWERAYPTVIFKTQNHSLAAIFKLDMEFIESKKLTVGSLHALGGFRLYVDGNPLVKLPMIRCNVEDASVDAVYARNGSPSFQGKNILVIGAGSIGGFLVESLAMVGAGLEEGCITIIDEDYLEIGNLTRHVLGVDDLNRYKSEALQEKIEREMPYTGINGIVGDAQQNLNFEYDMIIDATGQEAFSRWLNREHLSHLMKGGNTPILYAWLEGEGTAWRTLLVDSLDDHACWECLYIHGKDGDRALRFPHSNEPVNYRHVGCKTIVPYAATAAMQAAALACEAAVDWYQGQPSPRFRGGHRSGRVYEAFSNRDLEKQEGCLACSKT
ncbi:HesA/MoeB/ThiF family protein [Halomonas heilongjiangensis]|uniref:THIF-type NAD/FAD binding fold domain-containing protein n=1 Tax=Halomonas heilongjiangensis TaxID=1387883 RepID=A0A2N7TU50_9GAMM|nr:ThiF family adenylyltransferase [Halomonas heilongjiangensis]PMR71710.1 hypothetical protein C1H66_01345 [Halomonas heilongjiangensis]PXX89413.1 hypothetical protein CR158_10705 [Halomonas heilongjiangensis]